MLVDSHCHLDFPEFADDLDAVLARARAAGVGAAVTICTRLSSFPALREIARSHGNLWCSVGVHPHNAAEEGVGDPVTLVELADDPAVVGIGETGLDYYYEHSPREAQRDSFRAHIAAARTTGLPLIVHTRDADDDTIGILRECHAEGAFPGLIHCFSTSREVADAALELGMYISVSGILTFNGAEALREIVREVPLERLLVETDAPFLAPAPMRGKRNEPAWVAHTAARLATLMGLSPEELARTTTDNFFRLFARATRPAENGAAAGT